MACSLTARSAGTGAAGSMSRTSFGNPSCVTFKATSSFGTPALSILKYLVSNGCSAAGVVISAGGSWEEIATEDEESGSASSCPIDTNNLLIETDCGLAALGFAAVVVPSVSFKRACSCFARCEGKMTGRVMEVGKRKAFGSMMIAVPVKSSWRAIVSPLSRRMLVCLLVVAAVEVDCAEGRGDMWSVSSSSSGGASSGSSSSGGGRSSTQYTTASNYNIDELFR